jgi:hypothetical protein
MAAYVFAKGCTQDDALGGRLCGDQVTENCITLTIRRDEQVRRNLDKESAVENLLLR